MIHQVEENVALLIERNVAQLDDERCTPDELLPDLQRPDDGEVAGSAKIFAEY